MPFKALVVKLRLSIRELNLEQDVNRSLSQILKKAEKVAEQRNELLHALWIIEEGKPVLCFKRHEKDVTSQAPTIDEIQKLCETIVNTANDLLDLQEQNPLMTPIAIAQKAKYGIRGSQ